MVKHFIPETLHQALQEISDKSYMIMAGGTDLMIQHRSTSGIPPSFERNVCYIANLKELKYIKKDQHFIHIGSMTTFEELLYSPMIPSILKDIIKDIAAPGIRHTATIAGNIANASPAGDSLLYLYAIDAFIYIESIHEKRIVSIKDFITGPRKTILEPHELIKEIVLPIKLYNRETWVKVGPRKADTISKISFLGLVALEAGFIKDLSLSFGAVDKTVVCRSDIDLMIKGLHVDEVNQKLEYILSLYEPLIRPIDDLRSSKEYRKEVALNLLKDFLLSLKGETV